MQLSTHNKSKLVGWADQVSGLGTRLGGLICGIALIYLLVTVFGGHLDSAGKLTGDDLAYMARGVEMATKALVIAGMALIVGLVLRFQRDEALGQSLSLVGALLYFGSPAFFAVTVDTKVASGSALFPPILAAFRNLGTVCLLPGLFLVLRDAILRIWTGVSVRRVLERRWGDEEERKKQAKPKLYGSCWDMLYCRDFVRRVCPAFAAKKPCWRVKVGCYCDEKTILLAMTSTGAANEHVKGIMNALGLDQRRESSLSARLKRERCRRCGIYAEHQRQKYRLLSPMVFPAIGIMLFLFYDQVSTWVGVALRETDRFMSFLAYKTPAAGHSFSDQGHVLTGMAIAWLTIIAISYALRALEYLVFELQV